MKHVRVLVIGAGPAGLTAAYLLGKESVSVTVLESDSKYVGGIARTPTYNGYYFDIGGHRFFSKSAEVEALWTELLPNDMLDRPRSSRIFYRKQFFAYPLKAFEALYKLGIIESTWCVLSYLKAKLFPIKKPVTFKDWVTNHFGHRLFSIFFRTYTEKVWGMKCEEISADWAAQRIKGLSLFSAIKNALLPQQTTDKSQKIKTLIDTFRYPRKGPGMLWEACAEKIKQHKNDVLLGCSVFRCDYQSIEKTWLVEYRNAQGETHSIVAEHVISSAPIRELVLNYLRPLVAPPAIEAANELHYRDFLIVVLILKERNQFSDNWIYIHDNAVDVARIQNFKSWSPEMVPNDNMSCYGMEYFCFNGDDMWTSSDAALLAKAKREIIQLGLAEADDIVDGTVVRQARAYPVYDQHYQYHVDTIRKELELKFSSLHLVGRNGMHKYNNQDHAMMTAMLTVKNILADSRLYDVWDVNQDAEYHESGSAGSNNGQFGLREVPGRVI